jgi:hypothetical protein
VANSQEQGDEGGKNRKRHKQLQRSREIHSAATAQFRPFSVSRISRTHFPQQGCAPAVRSKISRTVRQPCAHAAWISLERIPWQLQMNIVAAARQSNAKARKLTRMRMSCNISPMAE